MCLVSTSVSTSGMAPSSTRMSPIPIQRAEGAGPPNPTPRRQLQGFPLSASGPASGTAWKWWQVPGGIWMAQKWWQVLGGLWTARGRGQVPGGLWMAQKWWQVVAHPASDRSDGSFACPLSPGISSLEGGCLYIALSCSVKSVHSPPCPMAWPSSLCSKPFSLPR